MENTKSDKDIGGPLKAVIAVPSKSVCAPPKNRIIFGPKSAFSLCSTSGTTPNINVNPTPPQRHSSGLSAFKAVKNDNRLATVGIVKPLATVSRKNTSSNLLVHSPDLIDQTMQSSNSATMTSPRIPPHDLDTVLKSDYSTSVPVGLEGVAPSCPEERAQDEVGRQRSSSRASEQPGKPLCLRKLIEQRPDSSSSRTPINNNQISHFHRQMASAAPSQLISSYFNAKMCGAQSNSSQSWRPFGAFPAWKSGQLQTQVPSFPPKKQTFDGESKGDCDLERVNRFSDDTAPRAPRGLRLPHEVLLNRPRPKPALATAIGFSLSARKGDTERHLQDFGHKYSDISALKEQSFSQQEQKSEKSPSPKSKGRASSLASEDLPFGATTSLAASVSNVRMETDGDITFESNHNSSQTSTERRNEKIRNYWTKKARRTSQKIVRYGCRQNLAKQRFRHQGRFIKKEEMEKLNRDQIYDPNVRSVPKTKQIFKITKEPRNRSNSSNSFKSSLFGEDYSNPSAPLAQLPSATLMKMSTCLPLSSQQTKFTMHQARVKKCYQQGVAHPQQTFLSAQTSRLTSAKTASASSAQGLLNLPNPELEVQPVQTKTLSFENSASGSLDECDQFDDTDNEVLAQIASQADSCNLFSSELPAPLLLGGWGGGANKNRQSVHEMLPLAKNQSTTQVHETENGFGSLGAMQDQPHSFVQPISNLGAVGADLIASANHAIGAQLGMSETFHSSPMQNNCDEIMQEEYEEPVNSQMQLF